jgi:aspartate ammonia-lyase
MKKRTEHDFLGAMDLPEELPWGIHTARALANFPIPGPRVSEGLLQALFVVKRACALTNKELGFLDRSKADAIVAACDVLRQSPVCVGMSAFQGGAGTSTNMMVNELIAREASRRCGEPVHPIEEVNLHQSTNDVYPTAVKVAAIWGLRAASEALEGLQGVFQRLEKQFASIPTIGKTELVEAVPLTLGAEFGAFAEAFARDRWRTFKSEERLRVVNLGGTAVGTGLTAPRSYIFLVTEKLREMTGLGVSRGENLVDQTANADAFVEVSGMMKAASANLLKICSDLRLLHLMGKIRLPAVQVGSSIMPGKVNPVILESVMQIGIQVQANDFVVTECASRGSLQINEFMPLLAHALLESLELLACAAGLLAKHAAGIEADEEACLRQFNDSVEIVTAFVPELGYERATRLVEGYKARADRLSFRDYLVRELGVELVDKTLAPQHLMALGYR